MFEAYLALPFKTELLGVEVTVERIDLTEKPDLLPYQTFLAFRKP